MTTSNNVLTDTDFDAYLPSRATSNAFVRARIPVKDKLLELGRALAASAASRGLTLDVVASDERPSIFNKKSVTEQWVFLWRDRDARAQLEKVSDQPAGLSTLLADSTPYLKHAFLGLHLDSERFEVCWRLHRDAWADVKNARRRLETEDGRALLGRAFAALPDGFVAGVAAGDMRAARECDATRVGAFLEKAVESGSWLVVARSFTRPDAIALGDTLAARVREAFEALIPVHRALAWFADDDLAAVSADLARKMAEHEASVAQGQAREAEWQAEHQAEIEKRRAEASAETRERVASQQRPAPRVPMRAASATQPHEPETHRVEPAPKKQSAPPRERASDSSPAKAPADGSRAAAKHFPLLSEMQGGRDFRERAPAPRAPRREIPDADLVESTHPPGVGARVRIRQGAFAGKIGTVVELDARGAARVTVGALTARVESGDLVTLVEKT